MSPTVHQVRADDYDNVVTVANEVWADRADTVDYILKVFNDWIETDGITPSASRYVPHVRRK